MNKPAIVEITPVESVPVRKDLHTTSGRWKLGLFFTLAAAVLWGMLPVVLKLLVKDIDAFAITWYRLAVAFAVLFAFLSVRRRLPDLRQLNGKYAILLAITCLGICVNYVTYVLGLDIIGPGPAQLVLQLNAVFVIVGGIIIYRERFTAIQFIGLIAIIGGLAMFFHERLVELLTSLSAYSLGVLFVLLSAAALASYALAQKQLLVKYGSLQVSVMVFGTGALVLLPFTAETLPRAFELEWPGIVLLLFGVFTTLGAFGSYAEALQHWETTKISAVLSTVPLITLGFAELTAYLLPDQFSTEPVTPFSMFGALVLVVGSYLVARRTG